ncbi:MAG: NAD-dependent epimerase/dehydratase family protein [Vicinamibacteraceae bacterium]
MHALVTGAAGFIASHVSNLLLDRGATVHGIDAFTDYYPRPLKEANLATLTGRPGFSFTEGALETVDLDALLSGVTHIFHFAAQAGVRRSWGSDFRHYTLNNIEVTQRLLEAVASRKIERFLYASTSSVYGDLAPIPMREDTRLQPVSPYGVTKLAGEQLAFLYHVNHGVPAVALRLFTVYGPRQRPDMGFHRFLTAAHHGDPISLYGDGEQTRDFTYVGDVAEAAFRGAVQGVPGRVYNIGGGSRVSVNEILRLVEQVVGRPLVLDRQGPQPGDMRDTFADTSLARTDLGFEPKTSLAEGLAAEYAWLKPQLGSPRRS